METKKYVACMMAPSANGVKMLKGFKFYCFVDNSPLQCEVISDVNCHHINNDILTFDMQIETELGTATMKYIGKTPDVICIYPDFGMDGLGEYSMWTPSYIYLTKDDMLDNKPAELSLSMCHETPT